MPARQIQFKMLEKKWLTPTVLGIHAEPARNFTFFPGQFLSLIAPAATAQGNPVRRLYSFASASLSKGVELCIKYNPGGAASEYLKSLREGDLFEASCPFGDFYYEPSELKRVCFISTSTGIAPIRSMALSKLFAETRPAQVLSLYGATNEKEILYPGELEACGLEVVHALSRATPEWKGFRGRVTDYLRSLPLSWGWRSTEFYLCGNEGMINEVTSMLRDGYGVPTAQIHGEAFGSVGSSAA